LKSEFEQQSACETVRRGEEAEEGGEGDRNKQHLPPHLPSPLVFRKGELYA